MKTIEIKAIVRDSLGKRETKSVRAENKVPAVIYNNGEAVHIVLEYLDASHLLNTPHTYIITMEVGGAKIDTIIREAQFHPVTDKVLHIDFLQVGEEKAVELTLPVHFIGTPEGVAAGGKLLPKLRRIAVKGIPTNLPESIDIDVTDMKLGSSIKVADIEAEELMIVTPATTAVASVNVPRLLKGADIEDEAEVGEEGEEGEEGAEEGGAEEATE